MPRKTFFKTFFFLSGLTLVLLSGLLAFDFLRDYRLRILPGLQGFSRRPSFSLLDSLPALSPGLGELEAFKLTADSSLKANEDRSIWLGTSPGRITLEYFSGRTRFDSTTFYLWSSDSLTASRTLRGARSIRWNVEDARRIRDWVEVVGIYVSRPRLLDIRTPDTSVTLFETVEGKTLHIVRRGYRDRGERVTDPDTSYPVSAAGDVRELTLLARGNSLAILNPSPAPVRLRLVRLRGKRWDLCVVKPRSASVYRGFLAQAQGPVLAYTEAGKALPVSPARRATLPQYFWLDRR